MKSYWLLFLLCLACLAACAQPAPTASPTGSITAAAPSETPTFTFTEFSATPTFTLTPVLIEGTLTLGVNVRSGPGTTFESLGVLEAGAKVQILSKDNSGAWYQILHPTGPQGRGWVASQYVQIPSGTEIPPDATATPTGPSGRVSQRLNVRSGPATTFDSLGMLDPNTVVSLTGKNSTASWFQIAYTTGPGGSGWVTAQYILTDAAAALPVLDDYGTPVANNQTGTPPPSAGTPTPIIVPAFDDGDSQASPAIKVTFSSAGSDRFTYSSQVSIPQGDTDDWVQFTPYSIAGVEARLVFSLDCRGNGDLLVELWQQGSRMDGWGTLACGDSGIAIQLKVGVPYLLHLSPALVDGLQWVEYDLSVVNKP
jgi:uncharacterized protein YraI